MIFSASTAAAGRAGCAARHDPGRGSAEVDFRAPDVLDGLGLSSDYAIRYPAEDVVLDTRSELVMVVSHLGGKFDG